MYDEDNSGVISDGTSESSTSSAGTAVSGTFVSGFFADLVICIVGLYVFSIAL